MTSVTRIANSSNRSRAWRTIQNACKQHVHGKFHVLSLESKFVEILQRCQTLRGDMQITAETMQTCDRARKKPHPVVRDK